MRTRHLVSLVTGVLIFSVLVPVCLSIWLAHRQAEEKFVDALDSYASRVLIRTDRVVAQAKQALTHLQTFHAPPCTPRIYAKCAGSRSHGAISRSDVYR